jgi:hypothetical protein
MLETSNGLAVSTRNAIVQDKFKRSIWYVNTQWQAETYFLWTPNLSTANIRSRHAVQPEHFTASYSKLPSSASQPVVDMAVFMRKT